MNKVTSIFIAVAALATMLACAAPTTPTPTPEPTATPDIAAIVAAEVATIPTATPYPTYTPAPTYTPHPTYTPAPTRHTTPAPTPLPFGLTLKECDFLMGYLIGHAAWLLDTGMDEDEAIAFTVELINELGTYHLVATCDATGLYDDNVIAERFGNLPW